MRRPCQPTGSACSAVLRGELGHGATDANLPLWIVALGHADLRPRGGGRHGLMDELHRLWIWSSVTSFRAQIREQSQACIHLSLHTLSAPRELEDKREPIRIDISGALRLRVVPEPWRERGPVPCPMGRARGLRLCHVSGSAHSLDSFDHCSHRPSPWQRRNKTLCIRSVAESERR